MSPAEIALIEPDPGQVAAIAPDGPAPGNPYWTYLATLTGDESRRAMRGCLNRIAGILSTDPLEGPDPGQHLSWHKIEYKHSVMVRAALIGRGYSPSHVNKHLSALRRVMKEARRLGMMSADAYVNASDLEQVKGHREPAGRSIHADQVRALLAACLAGDTVTGIRDAAIVAVLQSTGCRRSEVAGALIERYDAAERSLKVIGKGDKQRTVYIHPDAVPHLERWLVVVAARSGALFRPVDRWGNIRPRHLTGRSVGLIVDTRRQQAGLPAVATHDFRRTFGGDFLDKGGDLVQLQRLFGHASATTTAGYDRRPGRQLRDAVDRLSLPRPEDISR
jgi:site-specific recombinase XerD